jgi:hypothetical protein
VNIESLIEHFRVIRDRGELDAEFVRDHRLRLAKGEVNANFRLGRRGTAFPQHARRMGNGVFVECDRHRYETGFRIPGGVYAIDRPPSPIMPPKSQQESSGASISR